MFGTNSIVGARYFSDVKDTNKLFVTSMFMTLQGEGPYRGVPAFFIRLAKCNLNCSFCLPKSTIIQDSVGSYKEIGDLKIGDILPTYAAGFMTTTTIKEMFDRDVLDVDMWEISYKDIDGTPVDFFCTKNHRLVVTDARGICNKWVAADEVLKDEYLLGDDGRTVLVTFSGRYHRAEGADEETVTVRDFRCEPYPFYAANGLLNHNCDTFFDDGDWLTFDEIEVKIEEAIEQFYSSKGVERPEWTKDRPTKERDMVLVITGGEPMLQDNLGPFLQRQESKFKHTQIESNGTRIAQGIPDSTTVVISPKCSEKQGVAVKYLNIRQEILDRADCLKFVMAADETSPYYSIPDWAHAWKEKTARDIFCSPMNIYNDIPKESKLLRTNGKNRVEIEDRSTKEEVVSAWQPGLLNMEENRLNHEHTGMYCVTYGCVFNMQLHLYASLA